MTGMQAKQLALAIVTATTVNAQRTPEVVWENRGSCAGCSIRIEPIGRFGDADGRGSFRDRPVAFWQARDGRIVVLTNAGADLPKMFSPQGRSIGVLGRVGSGPAEFRSPVGLIDAGGDSLAILDDDTRRISVFGPDLRFVRTLPVPWGGHGGVRLRDGGWAINGHINDRDRAGYPIQILDQRGHLARVLGWRRLPLDTRADPSRLRFHLAADDSGSIWTVPYSGDYELRKYTTSGAEVGRLRRDVEWFPSYSVLRLPRPGTPPTPTVSALVMLPMTQFIMSLTLVPDVKFEAGLRTIRAEGQRAYAVENWSEVFDSIVEVIDVRSGRLVISARFDEALDMFADSNLVGAAESTKDGHPVLALFRLRIDLSPANTPRRSQE